MERPIKYSFVCLIIFALGAAIVLFYLLSDNLIGESSLLPSVFRNNYFDWHVTRGSEIILREEQVVQHDGKVDKPTRRKHHTKLPLSPKTTSRKKKRKTGRKNRLKTPLKVTNETLTPQIFVQPSTQPTPTTAKQVSQGHAFIYSNFEEQTNGARNLWQLEMWAKLLDIKVAEPFAVDSMLGLKGAISDISQALRFSDYYDIDKWNKMLMEYGTSPLVKWENFISTAPHQAIILYTVMKPANQPIVVSFAEEDVKEKIPPDDMLWLRTKFKIVRMLSYVCSTDMHHPVTLEEYNSYVFGDLDPSQVTLIIVNWIGIGIQNTRIEIKSNPSTKSFISSTNIAFVPPVNGSHVSPVVLPSQRVLNAYETYVAEYIGNQKYVGIVFRTQCAMYYFTGSFDMQKDYVLQCSKQLSYVLNKIRNKWKIFLAYDLDSFGSQSDDYFDHTNEQFATIRDQVFHDVFLGSLQMKQREERLTKAAGGIKDKGFIALLEKTIATHADCIILLGIWSSFVDSAAMAYISLHDSNSMCVVSICGTKYHDSTGKLVSSHSIPETFVYNDELYN